VNRLFVRDAGDVEKQKLCVERPGDLVVTSTCRSSTGGPAQPLTATAIAPVTRLRIARRHGFTRLPRHTREWVVKFSLQLCAMAATMEDALPAIVLCTPAKFVACTTAESIT
jgi:hypothetical protein